MLCQTVRILRGVEGRFGIEPDVTEVIARVSALCAVFQVCYAKELKEGFVEYTEQVVKLMVPLLKFYFHDDILSYWTFKPF